MHIYKVHYDLMSIHSLYTFSLNGVNWFVGHHSCPSTSRMSMSSRVLPKPGTADGDASSRWQVLGTAGSVHHWQMMYGLPDATVRCVWFVPPSPFEHVHSWPANLGPQPVECLPCCPGVLCSSWEVFVSTGVKVHTFRGLSLSLHNSMRAGFAMTTWL